MDNHVIELMRQLCFVDFKELHYENDTGLFLRYVVYISLPTFYLLEQKYMKRADPQFIWWCPSMELAASFLQNRPELDGDCIYFSAKTLMEFSSRASIIHDALVSAAWNLAKQRDCFDKVVSRSNGLDLAFSRPDTVSRPYHLHFTTTSAGGGDFGRVAEALNARSGCRFKAPETWVKSIHSQSCDIETMNTVTILQMLDHGEIEEPCYQSIKTAKVIQAIGIEAYDLFLEMTMWRRLPCAMALHSRLGNRSQIGCIGLDIMSMVLCFVNE